MKNASQIPTKCPNESACRIECGVNKEREYGWLPAGTIERNPPEKPVGKQDEPEKRMP